MQEFFNVKVTPYSLQSDNLLRLPKANTSRYSTEALCFKGSITWSTVPNRYKNLNSLDKFKQQIKCGNQIPVPAKYVKHIRRLF